MTRARAAVTGSRAPAQAPLDDERRELAEKGEVAVIVRPGEVVIAAPDTTGTLTGADTVVVRAEVVVPVPPSKGPAAHEGCAISRPEQARASAT